MNRIKEVLEDKGIKQIWLAEKLGKSFNTVTVMYKTADNQALRILDQIAKILEVNLKDLIK